jgi:23S rRNA pseudouridine1911/1915/1917 synthase
VVLHVPPAAPLAVEAQAADLEIHYEDSSLLVLCKPAGMVVHPAAGNPDHTLVNAILAHCQGQLSGIGGVQRPGIVHRLDKDTSGLMVIAKNDAAHHSLTHQFHERQVERAYQAIVWGTPAAQEGTVDAPIARHPRNRQKMAVVASGKQAATRWKVLEKAPLVTLLECRLLSGRTHQVRVHMQHLGFPLVGDPLYGKKKLPPRLPPVVSSFSRQALHAVTLGFQHPETGEWLRFERPAPEDFGELWAALADIPFS